MRPWSRGVIVVAQSPAPGGDYPPGTPINLTITSRHHSRPWSAAGGTP
jgi:hypothetical protein